MKQRFKIFFMLLLTITTLGIGSVSYAATNDGDNIVMARYAICQNCGVGRMVDTVTNYSYFDHNEICSARKDCVIRVDRIETITSTKCSSCGIGGSYKNISYNYSHSIGH